jgi:hypothetical protein
MLYRSLFSPSIMEFHLVSLTCLPNRQGFTAIVEALLAAGAAPQEQDEKWRTPLHYAAAEGHVAIVQALIAAGVGLQACDEYAQAPLDSAISGGNGAVVQALIAAGARRYESEYFSNDSMGDTWRHEQDEIVIQMLSKEYTKLQAIQAKHSSDLETCYAALQQDKTQLDKDLDQARKDVMDRDAALAAVHAKEAAYKSTIAELQRQLGEGR